MQKSEEKAAKNQQRKRSGWEKEGRYRYLNRKLDTLRKEFRQGFKLLDTRMRVLTKTLAPFMEVEEEYITSVVCKDEGDLALLAYMVSKGDNGITPTEACQAKELSSFRFKPFHITRRVQRMNARFKAELGKPIAESYSRRWVLTNFVQKTLGSSKEDVHAEFETSGV